jgi:glycosyltransferase involved in cell wall biosynthesis
MDKLRQTHHILQVSTLDIGGGAEKVAWNLFQAYKAQGHESQLAVGYKRSDDPGIFLVPNNDCQGTWARTWLSAGDLFSPLIGRVKGAGLLRSLLHQIGEPNRYLKIRQGYEDFDFPGTRLLLEVHAKRPDIVHCHNLHGGYFDLRALPWLSQQVPVVLTLHDAWLLSGHCAHSFDCERWKTGCGNCPDLTIYPAIRRDATAYNWRRKREIFSKSRLYVSTPSRWLMQKVEQSMLAPAIVEAKVIPNGVDLSVFHPANKQAVRAVLGIPQGAKVLLFAANGIRQNIYKDYQTMRAAVTILAESLHEQNIIFIALGEDAPAERIGQTKICFVPYRKDPKAVARYYQAADVYVHAARAEVWGLTITEALACGTPVVATAVGGIPEQVEDGITGFLTPPGDAYAIAARIRYLFDDEELRLKISFQAGEVARKRFDIERQAIDYMNWFEKIMNKLK